MPQTKSGKSTVLKEKTRDEIRQEEEAAAMERELKAQGEEMRHAFFLEVEVPERFQSQSETDQVLQALLVYKMVHQYLKENQRNESCGYGPIQAVVIEIQKILKKFLKKAGINPDMSWSWPVPQFDPTAGHLKPGERPQYVDFAIYLYGRNLYKEGYRLIKMLCEVDEHHLDDEHRKVAFFIEGKDEDVFGRPTEMQEAKKQLRKRPWLLRREQIPVDVHGKFMPIVLVSVIGTQVDFELAHFREDEGDWIFTGITAQQAEWTYNLVNDIAPWISLFLSFMRGRGEPVEGVATADLEEDSQHDLERRIRKVVDTENRMRVISDKERLETSMSALLSTYESLREKLRHLETSGAGELARDMENLDLIGLAELEALDLHWKTGGSDQQGQDEVPPKV